MDQRRRTASRALLPRATCQASLDNALVLTAVRSNRAALAESEVRSPSSQTR